MLAGKYEVVCVLCGDRGVISLGRHSEEIARALAAGAAAGGDCVTCGVYRDCLVCRGTGMALDDSGQDCPSCGGGRVFLVVQFNGVGV